ncbi:MAG TPA: LPS export ABC transporter ATP-binding protein [Candidatus Fraserbacteria bacterium]|nr:LPS export ABC transporter ATP-binding protein [Candidatus Fraserbacteria bacterium]
MKLSGQHLAKRYGRAPLVVDDISLAVDSGQIVGLLGPNGAGKTTVFHLIMGLIAPETGEVRLDGREITRLPFYRRARLGLGYLAQEPSVFRHLTVRQNLLAILENMPLSSAQRRTRADQLLDKLEIGALATRQADRLSSGERRRVEIARALAREPGFLLLDEPFSGVDPLSVEAVQQIVRQLSQEGIGILLTDHNVREALRVTDYAYLIYSGKIVSEGRPDEIAADPLARRLYLGERFEL